jgi:hypothetical protein
LNRRHAIIFGPQSASAIVMRKTSEDQVPDSAVAPEKSFNAFHGGKSFEAIGDDFRHLDVADFVINADVLDAWFDTSPRVLEKIRQSRVPWGFRPHGTEPRAPRAGIYARTSYVVFYPS